MKIERPFRRLNTVPWRKTDWKASSRKENQAKDLSYKELLYTLGRGCISLRKKMHK
jgi:hypothetical protein